MSVIVFGSCNADLVTRVETLPAPGETISATSFTTGPGGKGANQAIAAAAFGVPTRMIAALGDDAHGELLREHLRTGGVDASLVKTSVEQTGIALVTVDASGENQIIISAGANASLTYDAVALPASERAPNTFLAQLETPFGEVAAFLKDGKARGARTILNTAPAVPEAIHLFDDCDVVIMNQTELATYSACPADAPMDVVAQHASALRRNPEQLLIVTLGAAGAMAVSEDVLHVPARAANIVDTTGAGDTFCGVFAAALDEGRAVAEALQLASLAGSLAVERHGAASATPKREEILALL